MSRVVFPLVALVAGCPITETGNPEFDARLSLRATSTDPATVDIAAPEGTTSVVSAWLAVDRVRFVRGAACDTPGDEEIEVPGPFVTDAAAPVADAITARLPSDDYCRVRMRLDAATDIGSAPDALLGHSILVTGARADGTPWQIRTTERFDAEVRAAGPITLSEASTSLIVAFDVATWLQGVDLGGATVGDDGVIHIEEDQNEALLELFEEQLEEAVELEHDSDDDGELDDDDTGDDDSDDDTDTGDDDP
jgi:hypothetical protein